MADIDKDKNIEIEEAEKELEKEAETEPEKVPEQEPKQETVLPEDEGIEEVVQTTSFWTFIPTILLLLAFIGGVFYLATEVKPDFFKGAYKSIKQEYFAEKEETGETEEAEEPAEEEKAEFPKTMVVNSEDGLMLRDGPSKESEEVSVLEYGREIEVEKIEEGWAYTTVDGQAGWCAAEYLTEKKEE